MVAIVDNTEEGSFFQLPNITKDMQGTYQCTATTKIIAVASKAIIRVIGNIAPIFNFYELDLFITFSLSLSSELTIFVQTNKQTNKQTRKQTKTRRRYGCS